MYDVGYSITQAQLLKLEKRISKEYKAAAKDVKAAAKDYFSQFKIRDAEMKVLVDAGKVSKQAYKEWRITQMARGNGIKDLAGRLAERLTQSNETAIAMVNDATPGLYALNRNYAAYQIEALQAKAIQAGGISTDVAFNMWDEATVKRLLIENPDTMPYYPPEKAVRRGIDLAYGKQQITNAVTNGIMTGLPIDKMADNLMAHVVGMSQASATRAARTACTGAQNAGRIDTYDAASAAGIKLQKEWMATEDKRTRDSHRQMDGVRITLNAKFPNGCNFPGDPAGPPHEVYNCRCTIVAAFPELADERLTNNTVDSYNEWLTEKYTKGQTVAAQDSIFVSKYPSELPKPEKTEEQKKPAQFEFTPAATKAEAEEYIKQFVDTKQFGALGVSYNGIDLDVANEINRSLGKLFNMYDADKIGGIIAPAGNTKLGKLINGATAAYSPIRNSFVVNRQSMKNMKTAIKTFTAEKEALQNLLTHPERYDFSRMSSMVKAVVERAKISGRATVPETIEEAITHEFGHMLEKKIRDSTDYNTAMANMRMFADTISGYAGSDKSEYIAESFAAYNKGMVIDPVMAQIFERLKR